MNRIGLIVNPFAGMGGSVGLKGSDGVLDEARSRGARQGAPARAVRALAALRSSAPDLTVVTCSGAMGQDQARTAGLDASVIIPVSEQSTGEDTRRAAVAILDHDVDLLLFVGGDGTANDICAAVGRALPVVGVPSGVKMHSGVFAQTPEAAGLLAGHFLTGQATDLGSREVMDVDEVQLRAGVIVPRLLGYLEVPDAGALLQHPKRRGGSDRPARRDVGQAVLDRLPRGALVAVGPGTTAGAVMEELGLHHTLLGFDLIRDGELVAQDVNESHLLRYAERLYVVIAPTGGQGALLGRGNQQLTSAVMQLVGPERLLVVATRDRLAALSGRPLLVDVDDMELAARLTGMHRILVGPGHTVIYPVAAPQGTVFARPELPGAANHGFAYSSMADTAEGSKESNVLAK